jgi:hypothetical protein
VKLSVDKDWCEIPVDAEKNTIMTGAGIANPKTTKKPKVRQGRINIDQTFSLNIPILPAIVRFTAREGTRGS